MPPGDARLRLERRDEQRVGRKRVSEKRVRRDSTGNGGCRTPTLPPSQRKAFTRAHNDTARRRNAGSTKYSECRDRRRMMRYLRRKIWMSGIQDAEPGAVRFTPFQFNGVASTGYRTAEHVQARTHVADAAGR